MVDNTDAEGRLILTDGLPSGRRGKATHIIDIATLTGACVRALGLSVAGIMGNDRGLIQAVIPVGPESRRVLLGIAAARKKYKELHKRLTPTSTTLADRSRAR